MDKSDVMEEIAGFLEEYESCVRDHFVLGADVTSGGPVTVLTPSAPSPAPSPASSPAPSPAPSPPLDQSAPSPAQSPPAQSPATSTAKGKVDQYLRDIDGVIKTSREAQESVLGLANGLQGLFLSVMEERNQAVDDLKKSVSLLRCSVDKLQRMRAEMNRMADREATLVDREATLAAKEAAVNERLVDAARQEADLTRRVHTLTAKEESLETSLAKCAQRLEGVALREAAAQELYASVERREADLMTRSEDIASREDAADAKEHENQLKCKQITEMGRVIEARVNEVTERERSIKAELLSWSQNLDEKKAILQRIEGDISRLAKEKVAIETGKQAASAEIEAAEAKLRTLREEAEEIEATQEPARLELESIRAEIQAIREERESFEALKREIVVQGHRAIESAEKCRAEQMTLALIKRDSIQKASQLYINHLEAAIEFGSSPEFLSNLRGLLDRHFRCPDMLETGADHHTDDVLRSGKVIYNKLSSDAVDAKNVDFKLKSYPATSSI